MDTFAEHVQLAAPIMMSCPLLRCLLPTPFKPTLRVHCPPSPPLPKIPRDAHPDLFQTYDYLAESATLCCGACPPYWPVQIFL